MSWGSTRWWSWLGSLRDSTEAKLISWARRVSAAAIRRRADLSARQPIQEVRDVDRSRSLSWWYYDNDKRFGLEGDLPAAEGAVVARALARRAEAIPVMPDEAGPHHLEARRADALVAMCSAQVGADAEPDRATVVVHAPLGALVGPTGSCEIEGGPVIHPQTARRLMCDARLQTVIEDERGRPMGVGRMSREPPRLDDAPAQVPGLRVTFPGCGTRRFTRAHHIVWWSHGGRTDLKNLVLVCSFHHKLVHEYGWKVKRDPDGVALWTRPNGQLYRPGPSPPREDVYVPRLLPRPGLPRSP